MLIMAMIVPFRGIRYDSTRISNLGDVTAPPYDVISDEERDALYELHPNNVVRLILGKQEPGDSEKENRYTRAADHFDSWLREGILKQDPEPALYLIETEYTMDGQVRTRLGFISLVELEDFKSGRILPHEKTFSATKADRLRLIRACKANFSPIFSLFSDAGGDVMAPLREWTKRFDPDLIVQEPVGNRHRLWRVKDPDFCVETADKLGSRQLYIADGHHRYETALNFRNEIVAQKGHLDPSAPCNYVMMYLSSIQDPGLAIRPVHRLLRSVPQSAIDGFAQKANAYFDVETIVGHEKNHGSETLQSFFAKIRAGAERGVMGAVFRNCPTLFVLRVKEGVMDSLFGDKIPKSLRRLDVTVATRLVLQTILGFNSADLDDEKRILYSSLTEKAFDAVATGSCDMALIMNPTRMSHVEEVSQAGLIMPRKSTYFFPKILSGLVMNKIDGI